MQTPPGQQAPCSTSPLRSPEAQTSRPPPCPGPPLQGSTQGGMGSRGSPRAQHCPFPGLPVAKRVSSDPPRLLSPHAHPWARCHGLLGRLWRGAGPGPPAPPRAPAAPRRCQCLQGRWAACRRGGGSAGWGEHGARGAVSGAGAGEEQERAEPKGRVRTAAGAGGKRLLLPAGSPGSARGRGQGRGAGEEGQDTLPGCPQPSCGGHHVPPTLRQELLGQTGDPTRTHTHTPVPLRS